MDAVFANLADASANDVGSELRTPLHSHSTEAVRSNENDEKEQDPKKRGTGICKQIGENSIRATTSNGSYARVVKCGLN